MRLSQNEKLGNSFIIIEHFPKFVFQCVDFTTCNGGEKM